MSSASKADKFSIFFSIKSANLFISLDLSNPDILDQGPLSKAFLAAKTALLTSSWLALATLVMGSSVEGFRVSKVYPETDGTNLPFMCRRVGGRGTDLEVNELNFFRDFTRFFIFYYTIKPKFR